MGVDRLSTCKGSNTCSDRRPKRRSATVETYVDDAKMTRKAFVAGDIRRRNSGGDRAASLAVRCTDAHGSHPINWLDQLLP
jgi:hypothetical protein